MAKLVTVYFSVMSILICSKASLGATIVWPTNQIAFVGDSVHFVCPTNNSAVSWFGQQLHSDVVDRSDNPICRNRSVTEAYEKKFSSFGAISLRLNKAEESDSGWYTCTDIGTSTSRSTTAILLVLVRDNNDHLRVAKKHFSTVDFQCKLESEVDPSKHTVDCGQSIPPAYVNMTPTSVDDANDQSFQLQTRVTCALNLSIINSEVACAEVRNLCALDYHGNCTIHRRGNTAMTSTSGSSSNAKDQAVSSLAVIVVVVVLFGLVLTAVVTTAVCISRYTKKQIFHLQSALSKADISSQSTFFVDVISDACKNTPECSTINDVSSSSLSLKTSPIEWTSKRPMDSSNGPALTVTTLKPKLEPVYSVVDFSKKTNRPKSPASPTELTRGDNACVVVTDSTETSGTELVNFTECTDISSGSHGNPSWSAHPL